MFDHHDIYALDAAALHRLRGDVANLSDAELGLPTRCDGWTVEDLIQHMNAEREAILNKFPDPLALGRDVCTAFDTTAGRWIDAFAPDNNSPATVFVPKLAMEFPPKSVLSVRI
ncbi:MAG TPA: maleylpyruvate isomerase N-terminal domain-containing protein [Mycobacterium sp.]|nr:maleylpyruvate isomerase N-terminal domain-containing protein [Mycobacterium sp.]